MLDNIIIYIASFGEAHPRITYAVLGLGYMYAALTAFGIFVMFLNPEREVIRNILLSATVAAIFLTVGYIML